MEYYVAITNSMFDIEIPCNLNENAEYKINFII